MLGSAQKPLQQEVELYSQIPHFALGKCSMRRLEVGFAMKLNESLPDSDSPSKSVLNILVYQIGLIFFLGLKLLKKVQNLGSTGCKKTVIGIQKRRNSLASPLFE